MTAAWGWGCWEEDRRYPSKDGEHLVIVWKRTQNYGGEPKVFWKTTRVKNTARNLTAADKAYFAERASAGKVDPTA